MTGARTTLPNRRPSELHSFIHDGRRWTASFARLHDGRVGEIFLDAPKESPLAAAARESAIVVSLAIQFGCPIGVIRHALGERDASPIGAALALIDGDVK